MQKKRKLRCIDCRHCRADLKYERGEDYLCLRDGRPLSGRRLWAPACAHAEQRLKPALGEA